MRHPRARGLLLVATAALGCRTTPQSAPTPSVSPSLPSLSASAQPTTDPPAKPDSDAELRARQAAWKARSDALRPRYGCPGNTAALQAARHDFVAIEAAIVALGDLDDPAPALDRITALLESPCLGLARLHAIPLAAQSGLALRLWHARGGLRWLEDSIAFSEGGDAVATFPPTMPITLSRETHPDHPLSPWLCSLHDTACAATTAGWRERAQQVTGRNEDTRYFLEQRRDGWRCEDEALERWESMKHYEEHDPAEPYRTWARCMFEAEGDNTEFPLGGLRAPTRGWLVIEGRRGHYGFCDELHAYELETGAAHVVRSCSGLVLDGPSVDEAAVAAGRQLAVLRGAVPRDNVRELAFMLLVGGHVRHPAIPKLTRPDPPDGIELPAAPRMIGVAEPAEWGGSDETELRWSVVAPGATAVEGVISWPPGYNEAPLRHAANTFSVVEAGIVPGCAPRRLPAALPLAATLAGVSPIDASEGELDDSHAVLVAALRDEPRCGSGARRHGTTR